MRQENFYDGKGVEILIGSRVKYKGDTYNPPCLGTVVRMGEQYGEFVYTVSWDNGSTSSIADCHPYYEVVGDKR